jgi:chromosome condensin MukBEF MukE localization factor
MLEGIDKAIAEVQQPRSRFQIERFVLGQHATDEMKYYQTVIELQDSIYKYKLALINVKKAEIKIAKLRATGDDLDELKAQEKELGLSQTQFAMLGAKREMTHLIEIWESFECKYTREQIEAAQPDYWQARLTNNAKAMLMGGQSVNASHIEAMEQAGVLDSFVAEIEKTKKELV